ncbi:GTPase Era [Candidatus Eisenbacteria bacterium]|uniref:GTPase Era n=1 Tax=Eiseniibacteriota bacterium TaxID=2212470 RepID=A0ABV6YNU3_UNCEI
METTPDQDIICGYVAVVGRPNVGKSTLVNRMLRFPLSIVTPKPQTTRHKVLGILSEEGVQVIFLDSPGIMTPHYALQNLMLGNAWSAIEGADLVLLLVDPRARRLEAGSEMLEKLAGMDKKVILALNKTDKVSKPELLPLIEYYHGLGFFEEIVPISALTGDGLDSLKEAVKTRLPRRPPFYPLDDLTDRPQRFFVSEIIRQKVFEHFGEEIPYSVAVVIEEYKERKDAKDYIRAIIVCERTSQKRMLIGSKGEAVKTFGQAARDEIEAFVGKGVFLELKVDVMKNWRKDENQIRRLGQI